MQDFLNKKIVLGVCGGIAAYKSAFLVRELVRLGAEVRVVMTTAACEFMTPMTFHALSGAAVRHALMDAEAERAMGHIELARWADYLLIAPASADFIAKMAHGLADDLLSTLYLVSNTPVIICPAMNHSMWNHPATVSNVVQLRQRGVLIVGPEEGAQACGEYGLGRMSEVDSIVTALRLLPLTPCLRGVRVLITAGPTQERIDPVRYISNRSSGKMGYALAAAAQMAGADVILISGPSALTPPMGVQFYAVETAVQLLDTVMHHLEPGTLFIGAAAVADYYVEQSSPHKLKKQGASALTLTLRPNPDIIAEVSATGTASFVVGFSAETCDLVQNAVDKLERKGLDMIIANAVGMGVGFDVDDNEVIVLTKKEQIVLKKNHKTRLAGQLIAIIAKYLQNVRQS